MNIGKRIFTARKELNLTQKQFAEPLAITRGYIASMENCMQEPSEALIKLISSEYGISIAWLKSGLGDMFISPEEAIKNQIARFGKQAILEAVNKLNLDQNIAVTVDHHEDPELDRIINFLKNLWTTPDERIKTWAAVQFERAFPEIKNVRERENDYIKEENVGAIAEEKTVYLPVLGAAAAGRPIEATEMLTGYLPVPAELARGKCFIIRVKGDSMTGDGINDGDLAVIRAHVDVEIGEIGLFLLNNEVALKRMKIDNGKIYLTSSNKKYPPIHVKNKSDLIIVGKYLIHFPSNQSEQQINEISVS